MTRTNTPSTVGGVSSASKPLVVAVGNMLAGSDTNAEFVAHSVGSGVGVTVYDPVTKCGGLLHAMLPDSKLNPSRAEQRPFIFVDTGLPALFHAVAELGGENSRAIVKLVGGAQFLDQKAIFNIGQRNVEAALALFRRDGVNLSSNITGGCDSRTLRFNLGDGNVLMTVPGHDPQLI